MKSEDYEKFYKERGTYGICPIGLRCCSWHQEIGEPCFVSAYYGVCPQKNMISLIGSDEILFVKNLKELFPDIMVCELAMMKCGSAPAPTHAHRYSVHKEHHMTLVHNIADNTVWWRKD